MYQFKNINYLLTILLLPLFSMSQTKNTLKIFDAHVHAEKDVNKQLQDFEKYNIVKAAFSSSWKNQEQYRTKTKTKLLFGLMFPCASGIVPYSGQKCFEDEKEFPDVSWVRLQILDKKIDFLGELLNEYYGISPSDSSMFPYYALAQEFNLPIGIHTGLAGPDNLCPNYDSTMGNPRLLEKILVKYPKLKVWVMHAGGPYLKDAIKILTKYPRIYADISALNNPYITSKEDFYFVMKSLIDAGFEDRLMFGSDNGDYTKTINAVTELDFLTAKQKEKIFYKNAKKFFGNK